MTKFIIREALREDGPQVLELINELAEYEKKPNEITMTAEEFQKDFDHNPPLFTCYVVEDADEPGRLIAYAFTHFGYSTGKGKRLNLEDIFVREKYRSRKVGGKLFAYVCKKAVEADVKVISFIVLDWNPARYFYSKLGATCREDNWRWYSLTGDDIRKASKLYV